jgi:hypothetical protein
MAARSAPHVSRNRLEGSLADTSIDELLEACRKHLITGTLRVTLKGKRGSFELRAGVVDEGAFDGASGDDAIERVRAGKSGEYELTQKLPDLSGILGSSAQLEGEVSDVSLIDLMRHVEDNALSCTVTVTRESDSAEIHYRIGEIDKIVFNGEEDEDRISDVLQWTEARYRVAAPPLDIGIEGWPSVRREPTAPFKIVQPEDLAAGEMTDADAREVADEAGAPEAEPEKKAAPEPEKKAAPEPEKKAASEPEKKKAPDRKRVAERPAARAAVEAPGGSGSWLDQPGVTWGVLGTLAVIALIWLYLFFRALL